MRFIHKLIVVLALLALSNIAGATDITTKITKSTFNSAPKAVFDVSNSSDSLFDHGSVMGVFYSPGSTNDTIYVWLLNYTDPKSHINIVKRTLDAESLTTKDNDTNIATKITSSTGPNFYGGLGYIGFTTTNETDDDKIDQLYFSVLPANASSDTAPSNAKLTNNTDKNIGYYVSSIWWQDSYFYVLYVAFSKTEKGLEKGLYLQGIKGVNGSLLYSSSIKIASISNPAGTTYPTGGPNNSTNASMIYVLWKDNDKKTIYQVAVNVSNGSVGSATQLVVDSSDISYYPDDVISSHSTYGTVLQKQEGKSSSASFSVKVFYNGTTSESKELNLTTPKNYRAPTISSFDSDSGFVIIGQYFGDQDSVYVLKTFLADGSALSSQEIIGYTQGSLLFFADANGTIWAGYSDFDNKNYYALKGYLGKLFV